MSIFESLHAEKKMTFNHWRYRILHWAFNVRKQDQGPETSGLPKFLYTHYCPLFHLTNLIALLSPIILLIRLVVTLVWAVADCFGFVVSLIPTEQIRNFFERMAEKSSKKREESPQASKELKVNWRKKAIKRMCDHKGSFDDFWSFWTEHGLAKEEIQSLFEKYMPRIEEERRLKAIRREKWKQRIILWTNISQVFIKCFLNVFYIVLAIVSVLAFCYAMTWVWVFLCWLAGVAYWMFSDVGSLSLIILMGKILFWVVMGVVFISVMFKFGIAQKVGECLETLWEYASTPLSITFIPFRWVKNCFVAACEFVSMFYEENCPPIKLISEEEAVVEDTIHGGEE